MHCWEYSRQCNSSIFSSVNKHFFWNLYLSIFGKNKLSSTVKQRVGVDQRLLRQEQQTMNHPPMTPMCCRFWHDFARCWHSRDWFTSKYTFYQNCRIVSTSYVRCESDRAGSLVRYQQPNRRIPPGKRPTFPGVPVPATAKSASIPHRDPLAGPQRRRFGSAWTWRSKGDEVKWPAMGEGRPRGKNGHVLSQHVHRVCPCLRWNVRYSRGQKRW